MQWEWEDYHQCRKNACRGLGDMRLCYLDSQRPEAPHGSTRPFEETGRPISLEFMVPLKFFKAVPSM